MTTRPSPTYSCGSEVRIVRVRDGSRFTNATGRIGTIQQVLSGDCYVISTPVGDVLVGGEDIEQVSANTGQTTFAVIAYAGYVKTPAGERLQVDFEAPSDASEVERDAAFLRALAGMMELDYLALGESATLSAD